MKLASFYHLHCITFVPGKQVGPGTFVPVAWPTFGPYLSLPPQCIISLWRGVGPCAMRLNMHRNLVMHSSLYP
jgi:hypothetical protein